MDQIVQPLMKRIEQLEEKVLVMVANEVHGSAVSRPPAGRPQEASS
jgi:hypothetical protein